MKDNIFDFEKVNLIIRLAKTVIAKSGSYRITCKLNAAEEVELRKQFTVETQHSIKDMKVYVLTHKDN